MRGGGTSRGWLALLALLAVTAGCTARPGPGGGQAPVPGITGRTTLRGAGPVLGLKWDWGRVDRFTPYLGRLPGGATFYELVWCDVEPRQGQRDWSRVDHVVRSAERLGYDTYLKLRVGSCWATGGRGGHRRGAKGKTASAVPTDLGAYQAWVQAAVRRYVPMGVREYALENEANAENFWASSPEDYERLATLGAAAVRAADPRALVVDCGISSTAYGVAIADQLERRGRTAEAVAAYQRYYQRRFERRRGDFPEIADAAGLQAALGGDQARRDLAFMAVANRLAERKVVDVHQLHFYESWDNLPALLAYLGGALPATFPVQAWEVGMFWPGGTGDAAVRAGELAKTVSLLLAGGVRPVIWLPLAFDPGGRHADEPRYGLLGPDGGTRPAGEVFLRLAGAAAAATSWQGMASGGVTGVAFSRGSSSSLVVWSDRGATLHLAPRQAGRAELLGGGEVPWGADGVRVGSAPLLVTMGAR